MFCCQISLLDIFLSDHSTIRRHTCGTSSAWKRSTMYGYALARHKYDNPLYYSRDFRYKKTPKLITHSFQPSKGDVHFYAWLYSFSDGTIWHPQLLELLSHQGPCPLIEKNILILVKYFQCHEWIVLFTSDLPWGNLVILKCYPFPEHVSFRMRCVIL